MLSFEPFSDPAFRVTVVSNAVHIQLPTTLQPPAFRGALRAYTQTTTGIQTRHEMASWNLVTVIGMLLERISARRAP